MLRKMWGKDIFICCCWEYKVVQLLWKAIWQSLSLHLTIVLLGRLPTDTLACTCLQATY